MTNEIPYSLRCFQIQYTHTGNILLTAIFFIKLFRSRRARSIQLRNQYQFAHFEYQFMAYKNLKPSLSKTFQDWI